MGISVWQRLAALCLVTAALVAPPQTGRAEPFQRKAAKEAAPPADPPRTTYVDEFDQTLLRIREPSGMADARVRLDRILARAIHGVDAICELADVQKRKLELAGRGDIKLLFDRIDELKLRYHSVRRMGADDDVLNAVNTEIGVLRSMLKSGPFDDESRFARTLKKILTADQAAKYEQRRLLAARSPNKITASNAARLQNVGRLRKDVYRIAWSRDGKRLGSMAFGKSLEIHPPEDFQTLRSIGEERQLVSFDFSPDKDVLAIAENSTRAFLINLASGKEVVLETGDSQPSVTFSPDGTLLATGGYGTRATLWSVATGGRVCDLDAGSKGGLTPVFSPDGTIIAIGNRNAKTRLFDVTTGRLRHELSWGMSQELKFDPAGRRLAIAYVDGSLAVWDAATGKLQNRVKTRGEELYSLDWSADGSVLVSAGNNAFVTLWNADDLTVLNEIECPEWVITVRFSPDGTRLLFAGGTAIASPERFIETWAVP
jgi:WD40 repeat protein